jgi:uncharacterized beta-barrel protein YwiB (DUF1934 family)
MQDFLMQIATKIPLVGAQLVEIFQSTTINDYGEKPSEISGNTEGVFKIIENDHFLYYGEVRADDTTKILGKGIKVVKANL